ncbi:MULTISPECIES: DUF3987 domain-containing protein [unclassified Maridesulfovibrio]|uniref:DUF3987 domain-containing protein n=1 Tax=unclassified Maridesulfovibrio TaxID=2794999 RepID=UPI003B403A42
MSTRELVITDETGNCVDFEVVKGMPGVNTGKTKSDILEVHQKSGAYSPVSGMNKVDNPMLTQTQANNAFSGYVNSEERRLEAEEKVYDYEYEKRLSDELFHLIIKPVPKNLEPEVETPIDILPNDLKELVQLSAMKLGVPIAAVVHILLGAIFIAARGCYEVRIEKRYREIVTGYMLGVLPSGGRKSALVEMFRHVFDQEQRERKVKHNHKKHVAEEAFFVEKKFKTKLLNSKINALFSEDMTSDEISKAASSIRADMSGGVKLDALKAWQVDRLLVDSPTLKKIALIMAEQNEAIGIFEAEPGLLKYRIRDGQDNILLKAYSAEPFGDEVTMAKTSVAMDAPVLAINIFAQDGVAEDFFGRKKLYEDGLLPRFLTLSCPAASLSRNLVDEVRLEELLENYEGVVLRLLMTEFQPQGYEQGKVRHSLKLSSEAEFLRWQFVDEVNQDLEAEVFSGFEAFGRKLAGHAVRIAGAIHLWEQREPTAVEMSEGTMRAGIELARFYKVHASYMFCSETSKGHRFAKIALKWIDKLKKYQFTENEIRRGSGERIDDIRSGLALLERHNYLRRHTRRKTTHCVVHPKYNFTGSTTCA